MASNDTPTDIMNIDSTTLAGSGRGLSPVILTALIVGSLMFIFLIIGVLVWSSGFKSTTKRKPSSRTILLRGIWKQNSIGEKHFTVVPMSSMSSIDGAASSSASSGVNPSSSVYVPNRGRGWGRKSKSQSASGNMFAERFRKWIGPSQVSHSFKSSLSTAFNGTTAAKKLPKKVQGKKK